MQQVQQDALPPLTSVRQDTLPPLNSVRGLRKLHRQQAGLPAVEEVVVEEAVV